MLKIGVRLFPRVNYRQVVLTFPEQLRIPIHHHSNQKRLYSGFGLGGSLFIRVDSGAL
ncbi:hypothetical protein BTN49_0383 [Candidatus Enterovibrio escicola]|uniref:Uncharacterized protein n=1 Tax=Candidatus Enterovibrio escicola TaxID=1927127 RepID=A0A2A5T5N5_9GAMM|nr:hypothetical protein BTN49_0383 [Candidatus Enterovibrio escacola]